MNLSSDQPPADSGLSPNAQRMLALRNHVLAEWSLRVRNTVPEAQRLPQPILINTFPALYENLAQAVSPLHSRALADQGNTVSSEHGNERARLTHYNAQAVISEYQLLRWTVFDVLAEQGVKLDSQEFFIINASIDESIREAVSAFELAQSSLRERFVAALTHDLRNPLGAAMAAAEIIKQSRDTERLPHLADRIISNLKRMDGMIKDLLDVIVFQTGERLRLNFSRFDLQQLVGEVIEQFNTSEGPRVELSGPSVTGHWDREALQRAIENLIGNALKYSPSASTIRVAITGCHQRVIVRIHNEGEPIPPDQMETVFQVFRRASAAKEGGKQGWGIGLPYVRMVAECHGGSVGIDSSSDRGTTFALDLPLDARPYLHAPTIADAC